MIINAHLFENFRTTLFSSLPCKTVEHLAMPSSSFLSSILLPSFLKCKFSVCTSGEIGSFWISSLSLQSHWLPPIGCLQFLTALACLDSTFVPNPVILPKTVLVSLLLAEPSFLVAEISICAKICAKNMQIPSK